MPGDKSKPLDHELIYDGRLIRVERDRVIEPSGCEVHREVVRHPGAVVVLPILDDGRIALIRQYRYAVDRFMLEVPAGTLEPGEDPQSAARRELQEETGYYASRLTRLATFFAAPGYTDERMLLYVATELEQREASPDEDESIEVELYTREDALALLHEAKEADAKTLIALSYLRDLEVA